MKEPDVPFDSAHTGPLDDARLAAQVRRSAMDLLARREHSLLELERKLLRRYPRQSILPAITALAGEGLQSDERFAESLVRQRSERGYGPVRLRRELQDRGVDEDIVDAAIMASDADWCEVARQALEKKFGSLDPQSWSLADKARILRFAAYRGFSREHLPPPLA